MHLLLLGHVHLHVSPLFISLDGHCCFLNPLYSLAILALILKYSCIFSLHVCDGYHTLYIYFVWHTIDVSLRMDRFNISQRRSVLDILWNSGSTSCSALSDRYYIRGKRYIRGGSPSTFNVNHHDLSRPPPASMASRHNDRARRDYA